jgi:hypothetical protein
MQTQESYSAAKLSLNLILGPGKTVNESAEAVTSAFCGLRPG